MPIELGAEFRRVSQDEISEVCYGVLGAVFKIRREMGRFFIESIYHKIVNERFANARYEIPIVVRHEGFEKRYWVDSLFDCVAVFEWKSVETLCDSHRAQLLNYLMLCDLEHGKLVNLRPEIIEHEFVNVALTRSQRQRFNVDSAKFSLTNPTDQHWMEFLVSAIKDWGTGLEQGLYESASDYFHGGIDRSLVDASVTHGGRSVGRQPIRANKSGDALMITTLTQHLNEYQKHAQLFLNHVDRKKLHWVNIANHNVTFRTLH